MAERKAKLKYSLRQYTVYANRIGAGIPEKEIRKEYSRLRDVLNKRIQRINESDFAGQGIAGQFPKGLPKLADIAPGDLPYLLQQAATALNSRGGSLKGLQTRQSETVKSLRESGYTNINESNIRQFAAFMEEARDRGLEKVYGSDSIATMYDTTTAIGISPDDVMKDFTWWLENYEDAEEASYKLQAAGISTADIKKDFALWVENYEDVEKVIYKLRQKGENVTAEDIRKELGW